WLMMVGMAILVRAFATGMVSKSSLFSSISVAPLFPNNRHAVQSDLQQPVKFLLFFRRHALCNSLLCVQRRLLEHAFQFQPLRGPPQAHFPRLAVYQY